MGEILISIIPNPMGFFCLFSAESSSHGTGTHAEGFWLIFAKRINKFLRNRTKSNWLFKISAINRYTKEIWLPIFWDGKEDSSSGGWQGSFRQLGKAGNWWKVSWFMIQSVHLIYVVIGGNCELLGGENKATRGTNE